MEEKNNKNKKTNYSKISDEFESPFNISNSSTNRKPSNNFNSDEFTNNIDYEKDFAPYIMTIELDKSRTDKIKIFHDSNPSELAFEFCKKNSLDFNSLNFLTEEIDKIIKKYLNEIKLSNQQYQDCIEEVEEENLNSEVKLSENDKILSKNTPHDSIPQSQSEFINRKMSNFEENKGKENFSEDTKRLPSNYQNNKIYEEVTNNKFQEEIGSKYNNENQFNQPYRPNSDNEKLENKEVIRDKLTYSKKLSDNNSNFQSPGCNDSKISSKFNLARVNNDSISNRENQNYSYHSFLQNWKENTNEYSNNIQNKSTCILHNSRNQQILKKNERKNNNETSYNSNQLNLKKENIHDKLYNDAKFRKMRNIVPEFRTYQLNHNNSKQSLTLSKSNCSDFTSKITNCKKDPANENHSNKMLDNNVCKDDLRIINNEMNNQFKQYSRENSFIKAKHQCEKTSFLKKRMDEENENCTFSPRINSLSERIVFNNYLNKGKSPIQGRMDKKLELYESHQIYKKKREKLCEDYYNSFNFQPKINKNDITSSFFVRQENYKLKAEERKAFQLEESLHDHKNGQKLFSPKIMKRQSSQVDLYKNREF